MRRSFFIWILLLPFNLVAQQVNIRSYTIENGLVNNDILSIYQDSRGFIWLCTRGGLSRYDGSRFTNFSTDNGLINDMINDIFEIGPQEFMVAQNSGGPMLLKNDRLRPITPSSKITLNQFYQSRNGRLLATSDYNGIVEWGQEGLKPIDTACKFSTAAIAAINDSLWVLIDLNAYAQLVTPSLKTRSEKFAPGASTAFVDSHNRLWIGTIRGLKLVDPFDQSTGQPVLLPLPAPFNQPMISEAAITGMLEDSQGNYWIATINGLVQVNKNGQAVIYTQQHGIPNSYVNCIMEDNQKNIWIGTSMGVAKLPLQKVINTIAPDLGYANVGMLAVLPIGSNKVHVFDGKGTSELDLATGRISNRKLINAAGYPLYRLGTQEMMIRKGTTATFYHAGSEKTETIPWPDLEFVGVVRSANNQFIGGRFDYLYTIKNGIATKQIATGLTSAIMTLTIDKTNILWVGTFEDGLAKISLEEKGDSMQMKIVDTLVARLPDKHIRTLFTDKEKEIWIGTRYKGLVRLVETSHGKYDIQHYGTGQGLSSDFVLGINRDAYGNIWIGTAQGIDKLIPSGNTYRIFNFGRVNKFFQKTGAVYFTDNNYLLGTGFPSLVYARDMQQDAMKPLPVYITRIAGGPGDTALYTEATVLSYNKAQIYFEFSSPQYINEDFAKYSYRLSGSNDPSWNIAGTSRSVYFASLRPGRYTFEVRTMGFNGEWGSPAAYEFTVDAPFWQKAWFILLAVLAGGILIYGIYRYRVQQLIRLQKVRNRIATDLHDEIGSNLTNISILSSLGKKNLLQPQKAGDFLERISEEVSSSSQALDDIIWSVDASHDTLEETVARMRRYAAELFDSANISYELDLDPAFEGRRLSMEQRRDIYLLYKEAVNNISKHAAAWHVAIQITIEYNQLLLTVKDDGKGFDTARETNRYGLKGMRQRVKKWKGKITIESGAGKGTCIQVRLPVSR